MVALSPAPRVAAPQVLDDAARAAAVLSYKHHEPHLLASAHADLACRGRLEQHLADRVTTLPLVPRFLTILALAAAHGATEGAAIARSRPTRGRRGRRAGASSGSVCGLRRGAPQG